MLEEKALPIPQWMFIQRYGRKGGYPLFKQWSIAKIGEFDSRWERRVTLNTNVGIVRNIPQRLTFLSPEFIQVRDLKYLWAPFYKTKEFTPDQVKSLLESHFDRQKKKIPDVDRRIKIARFLALAGWKERALRELKSINGDSSEEEKEIAEEIQIMKKVLVLDFLHDLIKAVRVGQHQVVKDHLKLFFEKGMPESVSETELLQVYEYKSKYKKLEQKLTQAREYLKNYPSRLATVRQPFFVEATSAILAELNYDTVKRLETFLEHVRIHETALKQDRKPSLNTEQVLALAITGWVVGNNAAEENVDVAFQLWKARKFVQEYQNTHNGGSPLALRQNLERDGSLGIDVLARIIKLAPPPDPHDKLTTEIQRMNIKIQGSNDMYTIKLPPDYHHYHPHPVLIALHDGNEQPTDIINKWGNLPAKEGFILVAPHWTNGFATRYGYTEAEHKVVLDTIKDLRRRFQIDSDRVFLFGASQGGMMAYDVGLSHPDQFAGVLPMTGYPRFQAMAYKPNAQFLPFYAVDGQLNGFSPKDNHKLFKSWVRWHYPALFIEYKGRGKDWFGAELPSMMDWMTRKKRGFPMRQVGVVNRGSGPGEEFCTMRNIDNRFYWLSTNRIDPRYLNAGGNRWDPRKRLPATMAARIFSGNQIHVHTKGINQLTIWLAAGMIDFDKKVKLRVNGNTGTRMVSPNIETLMEHFYEHGDRQRLFLDRIVLGN